MTPNRKPISKRLRFEIFARDSFTCRYCGSQSDTVKLHVDHIIPVCQGGTNDEANLITSCEACNLGKSGKTIDQSAPNEMDRLRIAQDLREQMECAKMAKEAATARQMRKDTLNEFWMEQTGRSRVDDSTLATVLRYVNDFGEVVVYPWIEKAAAACWRDPDMGRYISGCRRQHLAEIGEVTK
jgi:hypothetical protein